MTEMHRATARPRWIVWASAFLCACAMATSVNAADGDAAVQRAMRRGR